MANVRNEVRFGSLSVSTYFQLKISFVRRLRSAYCGSLWLASLKAGMKMAEILNEPKKFNDYKDTLKRAQHAYETKLWKGIFFILATDNSSPTIDVLLIKENFFAGDYYQFDENSRGKQSIMADQLCGYWFLSSCDLEEGVFILYIVYYTGGFFNFPSIF